MADGVACMMNSESDGRRPGLHAIFFISFQARRGLCRRRVHLYASKKRQLDRVGQKSLNGSTIAMAADASISVTGDVTETRTGLTAKETALQHANQVGTECFEIRVLFAEAFTDETC